jgi:hypothetical protein
MMQPEFDLDIDALLAFHRHQFGDMRMELEDGGPADIVEGGDGGDDGDGDLGYPAETRISDMTAEQQVAYWKAQSQKHEKRASKFKDLTPESLAELREKADAHDALQHELMSDHEKALEEARAAARAEVAAEFLPQLVHAKFETASAGRLQGDQLAKILAPVDLSKFVTDGQVDAAKVAAYIDDVAPAALDPRRGPSPFGLGRPPHTPREPGTQGREQARKRFGDRANLPPED